MFISAADWDFLKGNTKEEFSHSTVKIKDIDFDFLSKKVNGKKIHEAFLIANEHYRGIKKQTLIYYHETKKITLDSKIPQRDPADGKPKFSHSQTREMAVLKSKGKTYDFISRKYKITKSQARYYINKYYESDSKQPKRPKND